MERSYKMERSAVMLGPNTRLLHSSENLDVVSTKSAQQEVEIVTQKNRTTAKSKKLLRALDEAMSWTAQTAHFRADIQVTTR